MSRRLRHSLLYSLTLLFVLFVHWAFTGSQLGEQVTRTLWGLSLQHYSRLMAQLSALSQRAIEEEALKSLEQAATEVPQISHASGIYTSDLRVEVRGADPDAIVRYSLDGSVPSHSSPRLEEPIEITKTTVLRVRAYRVGRFPSRVLTSTYILGHAWGVPAVSLVLDPVFLYDKHAGIITHPLRKGREWERPAEFAIMNEAGDLLESEVRVRIHGGASRAGPHLKNLRIYLAREQGSFKDWFGSDREWIANSQSEWVLKRAVNPRQLYSDRVGSRIASQLGLAVSPRLACVLYVNGERWAVYDITERINPEFAEGKAEGTDFSLLHGNALTYPVSRQFDVAGWKELYDFIANGDLERDAVFAGVEKQIDIDNLINYFIFSIFVADGDRPQWNIDLFKSGDAGSRWFFGIWDLDGALNYMGSYVDHDTLAWHLRPGVVKELKLYGVEDNDRMVSSTTLLRALMTNQGFRMRFVSRFEELLSTTLSRENLLRILEGVLSDHESLVPMEREPFDRGEVWGGPISYEARVQEIRNFLANRSASVRSQILRWDQPNKKKT